MKDRVITDSQQEIGIVDVANFIWIRRWWIAGTALLVTGAVIVWAFTITPVYRVETVLAPASEDRGSAAAALAGQLTGLASFAGVNLGGGGATEEALGVLRSHALTRKFIIDNNLVPVLFADIWDEENERWNVTDDRDIPTLWGAVTKFHDNHRTISQDPVTGLITLAVEWTDAGVAADWVTTITGMVNSTMQDRAIREAERSIEFLTEELASTNIVEVKQAISRVIEVQTNNLAMANARRDYAFHVIDPPAIPDDKSPFKPRKRLMAAVGLVLGGMLGLLVAFVVSTIEGVRSRRRYTDS